MSSEEPVSYLTLEKGVPVMARDGTRVGTVEHVLADPEVDIFDGIVIETEGGRRFVDAPDVGSIHASGVTLALDLAGVGRLHEPTANPAEMEVGPDEMVPSHALGDKLKRAWDVISGNG